MAGIIISIVNNKGGTAKTATTVNLGQALAREGKKVLVVDNDSQANATALLCKNEPRMSLHELYSSSGLNEITAEDCIFWVDFQENLFVLPNSSLTATVEPVLIKKGVDGGFTVLRKNLREYVQQNFDFCLIDCPPNMGVFVINSLYASDFAVVPTDTGSKASVQGLLRAIQFIEDVRSDANPDLRFLRVLLTKVDRRTSVSKVIISQLNSYFSPNRIFKEVIPINTDIQKAELKDETIFKFNSKSGGSQAYRRLAKELLTIIEESENPKMENTASPANHG